MKLYFDGYYSVDEIKVRYRQLAMQLHPDKGGTDVEFRILKDEYDMALAIADMARLLPGIFSADGDYTYYRVKVVYMGCDNHWYKFEKMNGVNVWVDQFHTQLIRSNYGYL